MTHPPPTETDVLGSVRMPAESLFGIHAFRARKNVPGSERFSSHWYKAVGTVKLACYNTNVGKSSFINAITDQDVSLVSDLAGTPTISRLEDGDRVLLLESCARHTSCDDIGRVKIPHWISLFTGKMLYFEVAAGLDDVPGAIQDYALVVQCDGYMATRRQLINRLQPAREAEIPITNYGMAIASVQGVYERAVASFVSSDDPGTTYL